VLFTNFAAIFFEDTFSLTPAVVSTRWGYSPYHQRYSCIYFTKVWNPFNFSQCEAHL